MDARKPLSLLAFWPVGASKKDLTKQILSPLCLPISPSRRTCGHCRRFIPDHSSRLCGSAFTCLADSIEQKENGKHCFPFFEEWSGKRGSNSRPQPWQGCALPTELFPQKSSMTGGAIRSRTGLDGFAIRCITALLSRPTHRREDRVDATDKKGKLGFPFSNWSGKRGSNSRPQPWQGCALPTELFPHFLTFGEVRQKLEF